MSWKDKLGKVRRSELLVAYVQIVLGCIIGGAAYPMFLVPNNIAPGGLTGVATVLNYLMDVPVGLTSMLMNIPLFIIGYKAMGRVFVVRSFIATVLFSAAIAGGKLGSLGDFSGYCRGCACLRRRIAGHRSGTDPAGRRNHRRYGHGGSHGA